ncbi:MAG: hypothetical protein JSU98_04050 [Gemmatimonadales bacterium]|jgi:hypothetical protein|nr:MAG: hypothetical protein JSU98_04050 [Gemmatimonadales bacterium]
MGRTGVLTTGLVALAFVFPWAGAAQVVWDGPMMVSPGAPAGWGLHLVDPHPGDGVGGVFTWRANPAPVGMGFRVGVVEGDLNDAALIGGLDVAGTVYSVDEVDFELDVIWFAGAGMGLDDVVSLSFPLGMAVGWSFEEENLAFRPYLAPRMVLDAILGDLPPGAAPRDDFDLGFAAEVGLDLAFDPRFGIRAAGSFGDREAISVGVTFPGFVR